MSRFARTLLALSLFSSLATALAPVAHAEQRFAQPPPAHAARAQPDEDMPVDLPTSRPVTLSREQVRHALAARRARSLAAFDTYQAAGQFPINTYTGKALNVWRDRNGHFCAAATIIKLSGQDELVQRVADQTNFIRLADVKQGPLMDWILTSGLTQDEIAMIQEPFMPEPVDAPPTSKVALAEHARLVAKYKTVEATIKRQTRVSLEAATTRLMKQPALAWQLVAQDEPVED